MQYFTILVNKTKKISTNKLRSYTLLIAGISRYNKKIIVSLYKTAKNTWDNYIITCTCLVTFE